jgi:distribution and morphology protein 31
VNDFLVTVYQPGDFRPFNLSIFEAQMPKLRRQWLFYDILSADRITGQVDGCLFSLHKPQSIGRTTGREREITAGRWKTLSRLRIDGINFDHIQNQSHVHGPVSWILSGKFDVVADIKFPKDASSDIDINVIISEMLDNLSHAVAGEGPRNGLGSVDEGPIPGQHRLSEPAIQAPVTTVGPAAEGAWRKRERELELLREENNAKKHSRGWRKEMDNAAEAVNASRGGNENTVDRETTPREPHMADSAEEANESVREALVDEVGEELAAETMAVSPHAASVVIDLDVRFKDIKAAVPLFDSDLTYRTQTFVRPIVAFMNANQTLIPVHCRVVMDLTEFDGALDLAQTGLLPVISEKIYEALASHVSSQRANSQRVKNVSQWWLRLASDNLLQYAILIRDSLARSRSSQPPGDTSSLALQHSTM